MDSQIAGSKLVLRFKINSQIAGSKLVLRFKINLIFSDKKSHANKNETKAFLKSINIKECFISYTLIVLLNTFCKRCASI